MYEEPLRMPFVVRYPREITTGSGPDALVQNIDFAPLLLDYAQEETPREMAGASFRKILRGETPDDWREAIYYRYWQHAPNRPAHYGIRTHTDKLIYFYGEALGMNGAVDEPTVPAWEYYDLATDPHELSNGYGNAANKNRIAELTGQLMELKRSAGDLR